MTLPLSEVVGKAGREARALVIDMAMERRAEVAGQQHGTGAGAMLDRRAPALARIVLVDAGEAVPLRMIDLHGVMQDVAAEQGLAALRFELDAHRAGRVAG